MMRSFCSSTSFYEVESSNDEESVDELDDGHVVSSIQFDLAFANQLARRARLLTQKCFSAVQGLYYTGGYGCFLARSDLWFFQRCDANCFSGSTDMSWIGKVHDSVRGGSGEPAALQRRFGQLQAMMESIVHRDKTDGRILVSSEISQDIFIFDGQVDSTSVDVSSSEQLASNVLISFPTSWSLEMGNVYVALYSARSCGRAVSDTEVSSWTGLSVQKVRQSLERLVEAGKVHVQDHSGWRFAD